LIAMTDYRTMLTGLVAVQAAVVTTAAAVAVRFAELALREGAMLRAVLPSERIIVEDPIPRLCELHSEWLRGVAALPRISALIFLGGLDRIRGPWAARREATRTSGSEGMEDLTKLDKSPGK
jgi:hypothetical protein